MPESWPTTGLWLDAPVLGFVHVAPVEHLAANPSCICGLGALTLLLPSPQSRDWCPNVSITAAAHVTRQFVIQHLQDFAGFPVFLDSGWENDYKTGLISKTHQSSHGGLPCFILYTNYLRHNVALMQTSCAETSRCWSIDRVVRAAAQKQQDFK